MSRVYISWRNHQDVLDEIVKLKGKNESFANIAKKINKKKDLGLTADSVRHAFKNVDKLRGKSLAEKKEDLKKTVEQAFEEDLPQYKETVEIAADGSHKSDKLLRMSDDEMKDVNFLLRAHGYDEEEWELVTARNNIWNSYSKQDGIMTLYASKITVKPKRLTFSIDKLIDQLQKLPKVHVIRDYVQTNDKRLLEIPLFDTHFGISSYKDYEKTLNDIMASIESRPWEEILVVIGQDMLHNDNFRGQTANNTQIETVDMTKAWSEALMFYSAVLEKALLHSNKVKIIYSKGNHDESMSWAFVQLLKWKYQQIQVDDDFKERKAHVFGKVFIGITHGDKASKNLHNIFPKEFKMEWAQANTHEIHKGHFHVEDAKDVFGMMVRTLSTRNKTDKWHEDNGFVGAHKRFMLFEYSLDELKKIHYV